MTSAEIDQAMRKRLPVVYDGRQYDRIDEYIAWYDRNGKRQLSCGLVRNNCIVRVPADKVKLAEVTG
jgi:hypothetical protein